MQLEQQSEQQRLTLEGRVAEMEQTQEVELEQVRLAREAEAAMQQIEFQKWKANLDAGTKIQVAKISAESKAAQATETGNEPEMDGETEPSDTQQWVGAINQLVEQMARPKSVIRDADGRISGVE